MKKLTIIWHLLFFALSIQAQPSTDSTKQTGNFIIRGEILDSLNDETIPYATILIFSNEPVQKLVKTTITDENGKFSKTVNQKGNYQLVAKFIGKKDTPVFFSTGDKPALI
ncbi:MAG: carboxypeptidase-like regulatory domain-containing protein [Prevotellaceae bacterium]|jgi:hypothetical protein|nr:carboxypeptidase-like regulatory domain-containing protein [Prevotellaceae bacterium]